MTTNTENSGFVFTESHQDLLSNYLHFVFGHLVRLHRSKSSLGLIACRQLGATMAMGDAIVNIDSHMEMRIGWYATIHKFDIGTDRVFCHKIAQTQYTHH